MQLDFIGIVKQKQNLVQFDLWTDGKPTKVRAEIDYCGVEEFFNSIDSDKIVSYKTYWESVKPQDCGERFKRWLFAFMSVHTSWESNLNGYNAIKDWTEWFNKPEVLKEKLIQSKVGLHNNRTKFVDDFSKIYWQSPNLFIKKHDESWRIFRNRLVEHILGLGFAKVSFGLEMCYPNEAEVTCMDTHLFQFYGLDQSRDSRYYHEIERHWIEMCKMWNVPNYIARCIYWDKKQNKQDSRYWSYVLEN